MSVAPVPKAIICAESRHGQPGGGCLLQETVRKSECAHGFGMIGLDFRAAPLSIRGRASLNEEKQRMLLDTLRSQGVNECVALSTCNRTEIYYVGGDARIVELALCQACDLCYKELQPYLTTNLGMCAACHLFRVCAGLESAVLGETEIVAQIKEAWRVATLTGAGGAYLALLLQRALLTGKRIRTETELCRSVTSTGTLAVREAARLTGGLGGKRVLLVGAGKIAERIAKELHGGGADDVKVLNRTVAKAESIAKICGGTAAELVSLEQELCEADVVITTVRVDEPILTQSILLRAQEMRKGKRLAIIDMGVPTNVERGIDSEEMALVDIDELSAMSMDNEQRRASSVPHAMSLIAEELGKFRSALLKRSAGPTIASLLSKAEAIRRNNVAWAIDNGCELNGDQIKLVEEVTKRVVKGLLEAPLEELNGEMAVEGHRRIVERLFHLDRDYEINP